MADSIPKQIVGVFLEAVAALEGVVAVDDKEARDIPGEVRDGACVIGFWRACPQVNTETSGGSDITWEWSIRIYVAIAPDLEGAQEDFYALVPAVLALAQSESLLEALGALQDVRAGTLKLTDGGLEPHFEIDEGWAMKELRLSVESYQPAIA
jgi:hypothetical protein